MERVRGRRDSRVLEARMEIVALSMVGVDRLPHIVSQAEGAKQDSELAVRYGKEQWAFLMTKTVHDTRNERKWAFCIHSNDTNFTMK